MIPGELDASWRKGQKQPVLVLAYATRVVGPDGHVICRLSELEDFGRPVAEHLQGHNSQVTWQMGTTGLVWFGNGYTTCHGDESRGGLLCPFFGESAEMHRPMAYGSIGFESKRIVVTTHCFVRTHFMTGPHSSDAIARRFVEGHPAMMALLNQAGNISWDWNLSTWIRHDTQT